MKSGMIMTPIHAAGRDTHAGLLQDVEMAVQADSHGYDEFWIAEHYSALRTPVNCPFTFLANLIARTKRMKLGTGVINLPYHHPAVVASKLLQFVECVVDFGPLGIDGIPNEAVSDERRRGKRHIRLGMLSTSCCHGMLLSWSGLDTTPKCIARQPEAAFDDRSGITPSGTADRAAAGEVGA